jgi:hypothetical protein
MKKSLIELKKQAKKILLKSVRRVNSDSKFYQRRKKLLSDQILTTRPVIKDIQEIRRFWSLGYSDLEIRKRMQLTPEQWRKRLDRMRAIPPADDTIKSFEKYYFEHSKYVAKLERRQRRLNILYTQATEEIESYNRNGVPYKRPRDLELARTLVVDLAAVDKDLITAEKELILIKQRLGIIDQTPAKVEITGIFNVGVLEQAWALRRKAQVKQLPEIPDENPEQKPFIEDALVLNEAPAD